MNHDRLLFMIQIQKLFMHMHDKWIDTIDFMCKTTIGKSKGTKS